MSEAAHGRVKARFVRTFDGLVTRSSEDSNNLTKMLTVIGITRNCVQELDDKEPRSGESIWLNARASLHVSTSSSSEYEEKAKQRSSSWMSSAKPLPRTTLSLKRASQSRAITFPTCSVSTTRPSRTESTETLNIVYHWYSSIKKFESNFTSILCCEAQG